ncbi:di-trans,poly-cis-decaprenylcistransferase [Candidatus Amesbacteria bacterium]|nr:di-trans,poly-cis-decaprenylcistransferase [Candidatus Amesbacteria bacterium]
MNKITLPEGTKVPDHVAMILDGNRRWARARGMQPWEGHRAGHKAIHNVARAARSLGVHTFTVWAFSTENWERPRREMEEIFNVFRMALTEAEKELHEERVRFIHLGRKDRLPKDIVERINLLEASTKDYPNYVLNVALDYGGRDEVLRAVNKYVELRIRNQESGEITGKIMEKYLDTHDQPYPNVDLFIRTSGEQRTSGLLPWQMDYAEYYFEADHLPDFGPEKLKAAILDYSRRRRRFGGNDAMEHLKFDPRLVARLEMDWRRELTVEKVAKYVREQYGMSKEIAREAGGHLARALVNRRQEEWVAAKDNLSQLYEMVRKNVGLALEPEILANIEVNFWRDRNEENMRELLAEKFRFSTFQAAKSAHLAVLAEGEVDPRKQKGYLEMFYKALKERVA